MKLKDAVQLFLGEHIATTRVSYEYPLRMLRDWAGPAREISDIKPELLIEYFQLAVKPRNYAAATYQKHVKTVKVFFNWCVKVGMIEKSPAKVVQGKKLRTAIDRKKAMTDEELSALLEAVRHKPRDYALIFFLADTGCRRGGAVGVKAEDIDWDKRIARVTEKGNRTRNVKFSELCASAILHWLGYRSAHYAVKDVYVFTRDGKPVKAASISLMIRRACKTAGIRTLSAHSLRHRKGHQLSDDGISPSIGAIMMGHEDSQTTMDSYYRKDWDAAERAFEKLFTNPEALASKPAKVIKFS